MKPQLPNQIKTKTNPKQNLDKTKNRILRLYVNKTKLSSSWAFPKSCIVAVHVNKTNLLRPVPLISKSPCLSFKTNQVSLSSFSLKKGVHPYIFFVFALFFLRFFFIETVPPFSLHFQG